MPITVSDSRGSGFGRSITSSRDSIRPLYWKTVAGDDELAVPFD